MFLILNALSKCNFSGCDRSYFRKCLLAGRTAFKCVMGAEPARNVFALSETRNSK